METQDDLQDDLQLSLCHSELIDGSTYSLVSKESPHADQSADAAVMTGQ